KCLTRIPPIANLSFGFPWVEETVPNRSRMRLFFCARRWPAKLMVKFSARITAQASETVYENWAGPLPSHADARLLRLCATGRLYSRGGSSRRLLQSGTFQ